MTIAREIVTRLRFLTDATGLRKYQQQGALMVANARAAAGQIANANAGAITAARGAAVQIRSAHQQTAASLRDSAGSLVGMIRAAAAAFGTLKATQVADEWATVRGRVALVTEGLAEQKYVLDSLFQMAQATGQEYGATADLFQSVARNRKELDLSIDQSLKLADVVNKASALGGGSGESQKAALMQLGQALGSGVLRGEELNSVMEQSPRLAQAIAEAFKVPVGQLKKLGEQGKLTSKDLANGLIAQADKLSKEFDSMPKTFSRSFTMLRNRMGQAIDRWNQNTRAADRFYRVTSLIVDNFDRILRWLTAIGASWALSRLAGVFTGLVASQGGLLKGLALMAARLLPFAKWFIIVEGISMLFEDVMNWIAGIPSVAGDILGPFSSWSGLIDGIKEKAGELVDFFGLSRDSVGRIVEAFWPLLAVVLLIARIVGGPWAIALTAAAWIVGEIRKNWGDLSKAMDDTMRAVSAAWTRLSNNVLWIFNGFKQSWKDFEAAALGVFDRIGGAWDRVRQAMTLDGMRQMLPDWMPGALPTPAPGTMQRQSAPALGQATTTINQTINTSGNPQAIGAAAAKGTQRGLERGLGNFFPGTEVAA